MIVEVGVVSNDQSKSSEDHMGSSVEVQGNCSSVDVAWEKQT